MRSGKILLIDHSLAAIWRDHFRSPGIVVRPAQSWDDWGDQLIRERAAVIASKINRPWLRQKKGRGVR